MNENISKMLKNICPQCKSEAGDILPFMPIIKDKNLEIDLVCENCGCSAIIKATVIDCEFKLNI